ncbi:MAG: phosphatidylserine decarboxylase family protein [Bacteroidetes bacterium]|nr:MAG: phosphatidylserine decarboxylase family protein [Bacteroidota bacterium]
MRFHREGYTSLLVVLLIDSVLLLLAFKLKDNMFLNYSLIGLAVFLLIVILQFFRNPIRQWIKDDALVISPADGKIVVIEKTFEPEYLQTECIQISVFMSPVNVHVNRYPISGKNVYYKYHPGKKLVAWNPKSSTENERTTLVIEHKSGKKILVRQIAGLLARRIVCYARENEIVQQSEEMGFIKFGSRVDVFLPLDSKICVEINDVVKGGITTIAKI